MPFVLIFLLAACSDPEGPTKTPDATHGADVADDVLAADTLTPDSGLEVGVDVAPDGVDSQACALQGDCAKGLFCHHGTCEQAPTCQTLADWRTCILAFNTIEQGLGRSAVCRDEVCEIACLIDADCAEGLTCSDHGHCIRFDGDLSGPLPGGAARTDLRAGASNVLMNFPIGLSMGGYGSRAGSNMGRYVKSLRPSHGQLHGLFARALALDNGERELIFIRLPIIFPTMALHEAVARKLQEQTGRDWRDSLVISGTHTHSGPTRYWHLPDDAALPLGALGTDEFSQVAFDWLVDTTVEAASQARAAFEPARMGWDIMEAFDTDDLIASDRWGETPPFDDNRLLTLRVDDAAGVPLAILFSHGTHGTHNSSDYFTGDAIAGVERAVEAAFSEHAGRFVPSLFFNQNGGSMSPRGDNFGHREAHTYENLGYRFVERTLARMMAIETTATWQLDARTHRFPITYEYLGYAPGEWSFGRLGTSNNDYIYGGLQCMGSGVADNDYATHADPDKIGCLGLHQLSHHRPVSMLARSQITTLQLNDLTIVTLPGEPAMELGWQVLREIRDKYGVDPMKSFIFGYAQAHLLYITPTNLRGELPPFPGISTPMAPDDYPDFAFSYLQGGYEASSTPWGFRMGDFIIARAAEATGLMLGETVELTLPAALPAQYTRGEDTPFAIDLSAAARVGTIVLDMPAQIARLETVHFGWIGGDPGAEMPQAPRVVLERELSANNFAPVITQSHLDYDNREPLILTRTRQNGDDWEWVIYWEELKDFPAGNYRFRVEGHFQESAGPTGRKPYTTTSRVFELVPTSEVTVNLVAGAEQISGTLAYPAAEQLRFARIQGDPGNIVGSYRMRHHDVGSNIPDPLFADQDLTTAGLTARIKLAGDTVLTLSGADFTLVTAPETSHGRNNVPVTRFSAALAGLAAGSYVVELDVSDLHANHGTASVTFDVP